MLRRPAGLPDPLVGVAPDARRALGLRLHDRPEAPREPPAPPGVEQDRVEHGAVDVVLPLVVGAVADAHRAGAVVAGQVVERALRQVAAPVDAVHDLQPAVIDGLEVGDELQELVGLPVEVQPVERLEREGRVAHPRVAVVPVPLAARRLRQRRREGGHRRAGRHVGQALDREGRALDRRLAAGGRGCARPPASGASTARSRRSAARPRPRPPGRPRPRPTTARRTPAPPPRGCGGRAPCRPRSRSRGPSGAGSSRPAAVASAACRPPSTSVHAAVSRP